MPTGTPITENPGSIAVIGAGIIGVCIAHALRKRGADVVLLDRAEPGSACSFGNSGAISASSIAPVAMPGILRSVPGMLLDRESPLYLPLRHLPSALPWLARFAWSSRQRAVAASAKRLASLHQNAVSRHVALAAEAGVPELILQQGHLHLYPDEKALAHDAAAWALREEFGFRFDRLDRDQILALEPHVGARYHIGLFLADHATVRNPLRYVQAIAAKFVQNGGQLRRTSIRALAPSDGGCWRLECDDSSISARHVVIAAGAWSGALLNPLGIRLPLQAQRGYHVQFHDGTCPVSRTVVLADRKIFITPMEEGVRIGGTVEIGRLALPPNPRRAKVLLETARKNLQGLDSSSFSTWMGHRPCMPDSVPRIGAARGHPGLWLAVGHGHLGLTDSAHTAEILAQQVMQATG